MESNTQTACLEQSGTYRGRITSIKGSVLTLEVQTDLACESCAISGTCSSAHSPPVHLRVARVEQYTLGQELTLAMNQGNGFLAIFLVFLLPVILLISGYFAASGLGWTELPAALTGLGLLAGYFLLFLPFRKKIEKAFSLQIIGDEPVPGAESRSEDQE